MLFRSLLAPVAPSHSIPTINHPTPVPSAQPQRPTPPKPSQIGNYFVLKCLLGFIGFHALLYVQTIDTIVSVFSQEHIAPSKSKLSLNSATATLAKYNSAIKINPKNAVAYYNRSMIEYNKFKDRAGAIDDMKQAARLYEKRDDLEGITSHIDAIGQLATWNVDEEFTPDDPK